MTDRDLLLRAVLANPDEDTPRLMYADAIQDEEPQRAEFIRGQIRWDAVACVGVSPPPPDEPSDVAARFLASIARRQEHTFLCDRCRQMPPGHLARPRWMPPGFYAETRRTLHSGDMVPFIPETTFRRGFADEIRTTAAHWLAHADALVWRPEQTVECPTCKGEGAVAVTGRARAYQLSSMCFDCRDGRAARPCPPTAQPITRVTLTTWPGVTCNVSLGAWRLYDGVDHDNTRPHRRVPDMPPNSVGGREAVRRLLPLEWPGITFTLPPA